MAAVEEQESEFEIYIQSLTGKTIILYTKNDDTILNLKQKIFEKEGIHSKQQRLIFQSTDLSDETKTTSRYGIRSGSTLHLVIRLSNDKMLNNDNDDNKQQNKQQQPQQYETERPQQDYKENWYYLENMNNWTPFNRFISLMLCYRYNERIKTKFALFSSYQNRANMRYLFNFDFNTNNNEIFEPINKLICYGHLLDNFIVKCDIPSNDIINEEIELLYLLNANNYKVNTESAINNHLKLLPHPSNPFLFGTFIGELIYNFNWMLNQEIKLKNFIIKNNINSIKLKQKYLKNKKLFKQIMKDNCGFFLGVTHLLFLYLNELLNNNIMIKSSNDIYQAISQKFIKHLKYKKIVQIQSIFVKNKIDSTAFYNLYLENNNFHSDQLLAHFLKNILSLKASQIQQLMPFIKSAFQINPKQTEQSTNIKKAIPTIINQKKKKKNNKPLASITTSFNIWLGRNILYNKQQLIKQQNDVKIYIERNNLGSTPLKKMGKKEFVKELHLKCQLPIGPLNLLYDNLPIDVQDEYDYDAATDQMIIIEFISNYLYQLRFNNIERIRNRCLAANINEETFIEILKDNDKLFAFLNNKIKIKNKYKINKLIPKIQRYAHNLYPDINIINEKQTKTQNTTNTFGTWLSQICYERRTLTKQQEIIELYIKNNKNNIDSIYDLNEWDLRVLSRELSIDATVFMDKLYISHKIKKENLTSKEKLIKMMKKILYDLRVENINIILFKCKYNMDAIDDDYFLNDIVINDVKLHKFLLYNIGFEPVAEIPTLIENIRKYLKELNIIKYNTDEKDEEKDIGSQTIYGNKIGRWIGEVIHDRLSFLNIAKTIHAFIISNHWNSGILPHIGTLLFVNKLKTHLLANNCAENMYNSDKLLSAIWVRLQSVYVNNANAFHATHYEVAAVVFEFIREIRRANIYQIGVECSNDVQCIDAKTFYTKIGSNKNILRKFINKILTRTNQQILGVRKELIIEKIYFFLSVDILDNNILFEHWLSNLIYDPVTLWLNTVQINNFLVQQKMNAIRAQTWGEYNFIKKAAKQCNNLNAKQLLQLFNMSLNAMDTGNAKDIVQLISQDLKQEHRRKQDDCSMFIRDKNINKLSFLNVTAINVTKLIEFIDEDLGIKHNQETDFVNNIIEKLRLCLKIHTDLFDDKFNDEYEDANVLFDAGIKHVMVEQYEDEKKEEKKEDIAVCGEWVVPNMMDVTDLNVRQLAFALCYKLIDDEHIESGMHKMYDDVCNNCNNILNGDYLCQYILFAEKQFNIDRINENKMIKQQIEKQMKTPWKYKEKVDELDVDEISAMVKECLLQIAYYFNKIENISGKIIDTNMTGNIFVSNLNISQNVFVHRMMNCFGDKYSKSNLKFIQNIYNDLKMSDLTPNISIDDINSYNAVQLANYLKSYEMVKIQCMITECNIDGIRFTKYKRHEFAADIKQNCGVPIGIATMLHKKMKTFKFIKPIMRENSNENNRNPLKGNPNIEFISLITKTLNINDKRLCTEIWNNLLEKYDDKELEKMNEKDAMRYIYGYKMNAFYFEILSNLSNENTDEKYTKIERLMTKFKWLGVNYKYFEDSFIKHIGGYFKSQLLLIIIYEKKYNLLTADAVKFLLKLDCFDITLHKLYNIKDNEIDRIMSLHKKGYNKKMVNGVIQQIKVFIKKEKRLQQKTNVASWTCDDIGLYLIKKLCDQMQLIQDNKGKPRKLCVLEVLFCIKYLSIFIEEIVKNSSNNMRELINRKAENQLLYETNEDIPQIATNIFVSWIKAKVPNKSNKSNTQNKGFFSKIFS